MRTEPVQVDIDAMIRLREHIASKNKGRTYGLIGKTVAIAIREFLDRKNESD